MIMDKKKLEQYIAFLEEYCHVYKDFSALEQEKLNLYLSKHYFDLDEFVKREQVMVLKTQGLEQRRERLHNELQTSAKTLRELIELIEEDVLQQRLRNVYQELSGYVQLIKANNERCQEIVKEKLELLDKSKDDLLRDGKLKNYSSNLMNRSI